MLVAIAVAVAAVAAVRGVWSPCGLSMLSSLNPVSETARGHRFWVTAGWYVAGAIVGGGALGVGLAVAAFGVARLHPAPTVVWACVLVCAAIALVSDTRILGVALPVHPRQVDERWLVGYRRWIYASGYGVQIGTGFATYIMTAAVYLTAGLAALTLSPMWALTVGLVFGAVRGLTIGVAAFARSPETLRAVVGRIDASASASIVVATVAIGAVVVIAGAMLGGVVPAITATGAVVLCLGASRRVARQETCVVPVALAD